MKIRELQELIIDLVRRINDARALKLIYRYVNRLFCR